ncbi:MAG: hypothetical protein WBM53_07000 [Maribacter sp.]
MINQESTSEEILSEFHCDAKLWKSMIGYMENEIQFINKLLNSNAFRDATPNLFEHLQNFKHEIKTKTREAKNFKKEINMYEAELKGILECDNISCDTFYMESHKLLKTRFEKFYSEFNDYKTRVFNYTGGNLL